MATNVIKRNGEKVAFDKAKIVRAVFKAFSDVYFNRSDEENNAEAEKVASAVTEAIDKLGKEEIGVEEIQDTVEKTLMDMNPGVAKSYILFRQKRAEIRTYKASLGIQDDDLKLPINTVIVLAARYLLKDTTGKIVETPKQLFHRVAAAIASVEKSYGKSEEQVIEIEQSFYDAMTNFRFMPNTPTLMNAGTNLGQLSACFVLPVGDSLMEIFDAVKYAALIHQSGGGTGFAFSRLRPKNDVVKSTSGVASGPISFMKIFDAATEEIKQGGKRRGANMGILRVDHPDILEFIMAKEHEGVLRNFNISVAATEKFMKAVEKGTDYDLVNPHTNKVTGRLNATAVWNLIVTMAWKTGDPGLVFLDRMNSTYSNPVPSYGPIESTNPCGEQPLYPYDSCNLGSINLAKMVKQTDHHYEVDWDLLKETVRLGTRFLDNVIDANHYTLPQIDQTSKAIRRIGLGVMGWADMLIKLGIRYDSNEALMLAERVMSFITRNSREMSEELAVERGPFPEFKNSIWYKLGYKPLRNSTVTTIAPTGTISIISGGASQGIEPIFSVVYMRNVHESLGSNLIEVNNEFERYALEYNFYSEELMKDLAGRVSVQDVEAIPENVRKLFVTAYDIEPEWHVRMQAAFQKYTDNAVSKTINFPAWATPQDIEKAYKLAYQLGCKGITVYRDSSKSVQVLQPVDRKQKTFTGLKEKHTKDPEAMESEQRITMAALKSGAANYTISIDEEVKCPDCGSAMVAAEGCYTCPKCGHSECG
ncbi:MAG: adenosylcobalamin-dependent ribonucleoside-diphosphate reductase [Candidatus Marsarchaeota archaeon]|jgi:ribonucleoside-diphosphate reductase alpha chain|nr:adenosylcobalamin-dependent ribonucleoside-diphosphate reductase [Candidatus Marsarchaeota archaeon]